MKANDRDIGENSKSTYSIVEGDEQGMFEVITDAQTQEGILRLKKVSPGNSLEVTRHALSVSGSHRPTKHHSAIYSRALSVSAWTCRLIVMTKQKVQKGE